MIVGMSAVACAIAIAVLTKTYLIPAYQTNKTYREGVALMESGDYEEGIELLREISDYRDAEQRIEDYYISVYGESLYHSFQIGDVISIGNSYTGAKGYIDPMEWRVIDRKGMNALLLSEKVIDMRAFQISESSTWDHSDIRDFLNDEFYTKAFTDEERESILLSHVTADVNKYHKTVDAGDDTEDYIFLLSLKEVETLLPTEEDRICEWSNYAQKYNKTRTDYWLRTPGADFRYVVTADAKNGELKEDENSINIKGGVRPAMWVDFTSIELDGTNDDAETESGTEK